MTGPNTIPRRFVLGGLLAGGMLSGSGLLSACSPGAGDRLRAYWWGDNNLNAAVKEVLGGYADQHDLQISTESSPFDGYWDKLATQTAGGRAPDLIMMTASYLPEYASQEALLPLDDYLGDQLRTDGLDDGIVDFGRLDGKLYGIIGATNAMGVVINKDRFTELGIPAPTDKMGWDEFAGLCDQVHKKSGNDAFGLQDSGGDLISFTVWARQQGTDLFDEDGRLVPTADLFREWFAWWDGLRDSGGVMPAELTAQGAGEAAQSGIVTGTAAMGFAWTQDLVSYAGLVEDADLGMVMLPEAGDQEGNWINAASLWSASANSDHADDAVGLINHLINGDEAATTLKAILGGPPTKRARELITPKLSGADKLAVEFMDTIADNSRPLNRLWPPAFAPLRTEFERINEAIGFKKSSVQKGVDDFFAAAAKNDAA